MRLRERLRRGWRLRIVRCAAAMIAFVALVPAAAAAAAAADLGQAVCSPWVPATALSLTLVTAVIKSQK